MQLVSYQFLLLILPLSMIGRWALPSKLARPWLLLCSYLFAYTWGLLSLGLLVAYTLFGWLIGLALVRWKKSKKSILFLAVVMVLCVLMGLKVLGFLAQGAASENSASILGETLPLGISFYTFVLIAYLVDVYRGLDAEKNLGAFALHMAFFPKIVAGPITRPGEFLEQIKSKQSAANKVSAGVDLIVIGLVKKIVIADGLAPWVVMVFKSPQEHSSIGIWTAVIGFTFQIYYDFSGYTDMARGAAKLLGYELPQNFNLPYLATNPQEFWRRWHMSLSRFLRDYLYIPMGGNRRGSARTYFNLMSTMVLGGLWHGMGLHFILWGAYHGLLLLAHRAWGTIVSHKKSPHTQRTGLLWKSISWLLCFLFISFGWILFRAPDLSSAAGIFSGLFTFAPQASTPEPMRAALIILSLVALGHIVSSFAYLESLPEKLPCWARGMFWAVCLGLIYLFAAAPVGFIYRMF